MVSLDRRSQRAESCGLQIRRAFFEPELATNVFRKRPHHRFEIGVGDRATLRAPARIRRRFPGLELCRFADVRRRAAKPCFLPVSRLSLRRRRAHSNHRRETRRDRKTLSRRLRIPREQLRRRRSLHRLALVLVDSTWSASEISLRCFYTGSFAGRWRICAGLFSK